MSEFGIMKHVEICFNETCRNMVKWNMSEYGYM